MSIANSHEIGIRDHSLEKNREKYEKLVAQRLKIYDPENIDLNTGLSPRKTIKNTIISYNGYYAVSFKSKKDGLEYSCDVNIGHSAAGKASEGNGQPYLMNCKNSKDSLIFPTHIERVFRDQYPDLADNSYIDASNKALVNTLTTVTLLDNSMYEVEYTDKKTNERLRCDATLNYEQMPGHTVDQRLELSDCKVIQRRERPDTSVKSAPVPVTAKCVDGMLARIKPADSINQSLTAMYDNFASDLDKNWPLPKKGDVDCGTATPKTFFRIADKMVSLDKLQLKTPIQDTSLYAQEEYALKNALVNQAYNRLAMRAESEGNTNLQWLNAASHSSAHVGVRLRKPFHDKMRVLSSSKTGRNEVEIRDNKKDSGNLLATAAQHRTDFSKMLSTGNMDVFYDMYWQQLAAYYCGPRKAAALNKELMNQMKNLERHDLAQQAEYLANAWDIIADGAESQPKNETLIAMGNQQLLWVEQHDVLQKTMYSTKEAKIVNKLGILNDLATADYIPGVKSSPPNFSEYAKKNDKPADLSNFDVRFDWMKDVITQQTQQFNEARAQGTMKSIFLSPLYDSYMLLSDYKKK